MTEDGDADFPLDKRLGRIEGDLRELKDGQKRLESEFQELKGDVQELKVDVQELKAGQRNLEQRQRGVESEVQNLRQEQEKGFKTILDFLNEQSVKDQRQIEMLIEHHQSDMSIQGEGFKANRDRLDDHETRIQKLEAS
jgi:chromosome segregation ATPase